MKKLLSSITGKKLLWVSFVGMFLILFADMASALNVGDMASNVYNNFTKLTKLIIGGSYLAGIGFAVGAIMKFKAHKDQPTQITVGTPVALVFISAALLFLPTILHIAGGTMFGGSGAANSGPSGTVFK